MSADSSQSLATQREPTEAPDKAHESLWQLRTRVAEVIDDNQKATPAIWAWVQKQRSEPEWWNELLRRFVEEQEGTTTAHLTPQALRVVFDELAAEWRRETKGESFAHRRAMHFAYQEIIGLGPDAVPLILESLAAEVDDWFWALVAITRHDVAEGVSNANAAAARWLEWGETTGRLRAHALGRLSAGV
jgi:hypothetical protein